MAANLRNLMAVLFLLIPLSLVAQLSNAGINGTVKDSSGAIVRDAKVDLRNVGTNEHRSDVSNRDGYFALTALSPGNYQVTVKYEGFSSWVGSLTLRVGQTASLDAVLKPGATTTTVDVNVTPVINRVDPEISDVKEAARIENLPVLDRNFQSILNFSPGVVAGGFAGQGNNFTRVNGIPGGSIDYLVDGQTANERYTNELQRTSPSVDTIQEVKVTTSNGAAEYQHPGQIEVVTKAGTNTLHGELYELNLSSHFTAHTYHSNLPVNFEVHNEFGGNIGGPVFIPKIYNGHNKTFFFLDIEGLREVKQGGAKYYLPYANWKTGDFHDYVNTSGGAVTIYDPESTHYDAVAKTYVRTAFPGNQIPLSRLNPAALKVLSYLPSPNNGVVGVQQQNYQDPLKGNRSNERVTGKIDQTIGTGLISARYTWVSENSLAVGYLLNPNVFTRSGHNGALSYTQPITQNLVNELRMGVQLFHGYTGPQPISPPITQTLGLPTYPGTVAWPGVFFDDANNGNLDGIDRNNPKDQPGTTVDAADNVNYTKGKHAFKAGFSYNYTTVSTYETGQPGGNYSFSGDFTALMDPAKAALGNFNVITANTGAGLADMLLGNTDYAGLNQYPHFHTRQDYYGAYVQDDWKVTPSLVFNIGLRYDYWTSFTDKGNQTANLDLSTGINPTIVYSGSAATPSVDPLALQGYMNGGLTFKSAAAAGFPPSLWNMDKKNFAPRIGFAFQANSKTVFRGGYGIYYWAMPLVQYHQQTRKNIPFSLSFNSNTDDSNPVAAELTYPVGPPSYANQSSGSRTFGKTFITPNAVSIAEGQGWAVAPWDPNYHPQRVQQYNLTLERELPYRFGARLSYIGNHSDHLVMFDPINALTPINFSAPGATIQQRRKYTHFAKSTANAMDLIRYNGQANTNSLQAEVKQSVNPDLLIQAFFVWQHVLTTAEGAASGFGALEMTPAALNPALPDTERLRNVYANDSSLPRYTFSVNAHYVLPFGHGKRFLAHQNGFVNRLVSGYNLTAFYYQRSGLFFSPYYASGAQANILAPGRTPELPKNKRTRTQWFDASRYTTAMQNKKIPYAGQTYIQRQPSEADQLGNIPRNALTGPGFNNMDATISKNTPIKGQFVFRMDAQFFNVYNHVNLTVPNNNGITVNQLGTPRTIQLQAKLIF
jgi:hypothetical protein